MKSDAVHQTKSSNRLSPPFPTHIAGELHCYDEHLRDVIGLADRTRKGRLRVAGLLLQEIFKKRAIEIARLRPEDIRQFIAARTGAPRSVAHTSHMATSLRSYLRYRATCGDEVGRLTAVILNPVHWKLASLPRALKAEDTERLLGTVAAARRWPKRNYAIVRCALDMGLRVGEIAHLTLDDIDWRAGTMTLRGTKSLRRDVLPLPLATGEALADYLQHERTATCHTALFIRQLAGKDRQITSWAIQKVIKRALGRIGLSQSSAHALRHTVACRLVENGSSLKEVADLLRHRSLNSTQIYAKLDISKLTGVALPWPGSTP